MNQENYNYQDHTVFVQERSVGKKFLANVFTWMFVALAISAVTAYITISTPYIFPYLVENGKPSILGWAAIFGPIGLILLMGVGYRKLSFVGLIAFFVVYSVLTGLMLSFALSQYTGTSIAICFVAATSIFGVMAVMGYTTNTDLSQFRSILMAGVIGLIVVSVINMFIGSAAIEYFLGFFGVAIFTALTAYKVQEIKRIGAGLDEYGDEMAIEDTKKLALIGALSLYITFINLFISLLRIFGGRK